MTMGQILTGVIAKNNVDLDWLADEALCEINLTYEDALRDHAAACEDKDCEINGHESFGEMWESDSDDTRLLGSWAKNIHGEYVHDTRGDYCAVERESTLQVVWSRYIANVASMCSPCFPMQADLDSGPGEIKAFTLPPEAFYTEDK